MASPPPLLAPDHPLLDKAVMASLARCQIDPEWAPTVRALATGSLPAETIQCCHGDCRPCVQDILRCSRMTLEALQNETTKGEGSEALLEDESSGPLRGVGRRITAAVRRRFRWRLEK